MFFVALEYIIEAAKGILTIVKRLNYNCKKNV